MDRVPTVPAAKPHHPDAHPGLQRDQEDNKELADVHGQQPEGESSD